MCTSDTCPIYTCPCSPPTYPVGLQDLLDVTLVCDDSYQLIIVDLESSKPDQNKPTRPTYPTNFPI